MPRVTITNICLARMVIKALSKVVFYDHDGTIKHENFIKWCATNVVQGPKVFHIFEVTEKTARNFNAATVPSYKSFYFYFIK
jgi:hypothetical protein